MKRGDRPRLVLVPDPLGETGDSGAEGGAPPLRNASPGMPVASRASDPAPDELAAAAEALAVLLRGLAPFESAGRARTGDEDPER